MKEVATTKKFELLCIFMLSFGQLCIFTGYDSQLFILESVIQSIHEREPEKISVHAGYHGQAVCYLTYVLACFVSPSFLYATSSKTTLLISAICFTSFPIGFLFINSYYYYFSSAVLGIGFALYYTGNGGYMTSHSTRQTIGSNVSLSWGFGCCCLMIGSIILTVIISFTFDQTEVTTVVSHHVRINFSDSEIYLLFSTFSAISMIAVLTFILLPSKDVSNCMESNEKNVKFVEGLRLMKKALVSPKMFRLSPFFILCGIHTSFWLLVYPTSLMLNLHNSSMIYLPAIYCFAVGFGETSMGIVISTISKRIKDFSLCPTMLIGCITLILYCVLALLTTPVNSTTNPTSIEPLLFQPTRISVFIIGLIIGTSDCCLCSVRSMICAIAMPNRRAQAFSVSKIYQSSATCIVFFISPYLNVYYYTIGLPILCVFSGIFFFREASRIKRMEFENGMEPEAMAERRVTVEAETASTCRKIRE